uniref:Isochorismatase-like domain-containing protein n=1 Tax=Amphora coffeiformis TaxID=265554 RepID=A0A6S8JFR8_9STRA
MSDNSKNNNGSILPPQQSSPRRMFVPAKATTPQDKEEEKKEPFPDMDVDVLALTTTTPPPNPLEDCWYTAAPALPLGVGVVADLWKQVTWYPVVDNEPEAGSSSEQSLRTSPKYSSSNKSKPAVRRWMAIQGAVFQEEAWMNAGASNGSRTPGSSSSTTTKSNTHAAPSPVSRPLFRHPGMWTTGEPYRAEAFTPLVARIRNALPAALEGSPSHHTTSFWNHVTLECWQWNENFSIIAEEESPATATTGGDKKKKKQRSVTVARERIDPTLDLEPASSVVRVFLSGPLCEDEDAAATEKRPATTTNETTKTSPKAKHEDEELRDILPSEEERIGSIYLRPKRYDRDNQRRPTPRPQHALPVPHNAVFSLGWYTNQAMTHEISLRPPTLSSQTSSSGRCTMVLTFRHVSTWLVEREGRVPQVVGRLGRDNENDEELASPRMHSEEDRIAEWKRLSQAFFEEKRQEGLATEQVYGAGSFLVPQARTKPCLSRVLVSPSHASYYQSQLDRDDGLSVNTLSSISNSVSTTNHTSITSRPIHSISVVESSEHADEDDDDHWPDDTSGMDLELMSGSAVALLVVDLQNDFLGDDPSFSFCRLTHKVSPLAGPRRTRLLKRIDELASQVRDQKGVVVFCRSVYGRWSQSLASRQSSEDLEGARKSSEDNTPSMPGKKSTPDEASADGSTATGSSIVTVKAGTHLNKDSCCSVGTKGSDFYPDAAKMIEEDDIVLTKEWYSAFLETSLHAQLQRLGVQTVVVCGVTTNHSVAATVRSAAHLGYQVIVSSDGTAQIDPSLQPQTEAKLQAYASILAPKMSLKGLLAPAPVEPRSLGNGRDRLDFDGWNRLSAVGAGDSFLLPGCFDPTDAEDMLQKMRPRKKGSSEVAWRYHSEMGGNGPLRTAYQCGRNESGDVPVCRLALHKDQVVCDWSKSVAQAKPQVETQAGHSFNFVRLVHHKTPNDSVRFRSDMCLDMKEGTSIAIVALGEGMLLELRPKPGLGSSATAQKIYLRHNTLFLLGPETNRLFQYSIRCSRKAPKNKHRISMTFRDLVTFQAKEEKLIYGPGTRYNTLQDYRAQSRTRKMWEGAAMVAFGASSLTLLHARGKMPDSIALAAAPVAGIMAVYQYMNHRRKAGLRDDESRLEQTFVRCNWQPLRFSEAKQLFLNASDAELFGKKADSRLASP